MVYSTLRWLDVYHNFVLRYRGLWWDFWNVLEKWIECNVIDKFELSNDLTVKLQFKNNKQSLEIEPNFILLDTKYQVPES